MIGGLREGVRTGGPRASQLGRLAEWGRRFLRTEDESGLEAEVLLRAATGFSRERIYSHPETKVAQGDMLRYWRMVRERSRTGCPVAYITGEKEFAGMPLRMRRGVFVPRPETEGLVELIQGIMGRGDTAERTVVDTCCGSGAVGIALARSLGMRVVAIDVCKEAVALARENARRLGVGHLVKARVGRCLEPLSRIKLHSRVGLVAANPPYVPTAELGSLPRDIANFEPRAALDGGPNGLEVAAEISAQAQKWLAPGAFLAMEIGESQEREIGTVLRGHGFGSVRVERDLGGKPRYVLARAIGNKSPA